MALEKLDDSDLQNFDDWAAYHRLPSSDPQNDTDGDGSSDILESYFGQNPWAADSIPPFSLASSITNNQQTVVLEFQRPSFARDFNVFFESSEDLENWSPATNVTETVTQSGLELEIVRLGIPVDTRFLFFRATLNDLVP